MPSTRKSTMTNTDNMKEFDFFDIAVTTPFYNHNGILKIYAQNDYQRLSQASIERKTDVSQGTIYRTVRDAKIMKTMKNGHGVGPTDLGKRWGQEVLRNGEVSRETLKTACLNVPLFKKAYEEMPDVTDKETLYGFFQNHAREDTKSKHIGGAVKRYLEGIYGESVGRVKKKTWNEKSKDDSIGGYQVSLEKIEKLFDKSIKDRNLTPRRDKERLVSAYYKLIDEFGEDEVEKCHNYIFS